MKCGIFFLLLFLASLTYAGECVSDLRGKHSDDGIEEIGDFADLNGDGVAEKIVFMRGSMRARYAVIYQESAKGCYTELYSGSENVVQGAVPEAFHGTNRIEKDEFDGY